MGGFPEGYFCPNPDDDTLYFFLGEDDPLTLNDVKVRVGFKEREAPHPVCYCFDYAKEAIQDDYRQHGECRIESFIRDMVAKDLCACEVKNPTGRCCLGEVRAAYRALGQPAAELATV